MDKGGFPAAGYLLLLILAIIVPVIVMKLIYYQLDRYERHHNGSIDHSTISNQSRQSSQSYSNTLQILPVRA